MALPSNISADIKAILTAPGVDLDSISAKRVRKALEEQHPDLDTKNLKAEIDAIIVPLFHEVRAEREAVERAAKLASKPKAAKPAASVVKRKRSPSEDGIPSSSPFPLATNGSKKMTDEEMARRLHEEMNGHSRPTRGGSSTKAKRSGGAGSASKRGNKKKSSAYVEDSDDEGTSSRVGMGSDDDDGEGAGGVKKAKRKRKSSGGGGGGGGGYNKEMTCSPALAELIGCETCSRPQVVKKIWAHIKANDLQNPSDRRQILCDEPMRKVFNVPSVHMFTMNKLLGEHLYDGTDVVA